MSLWVTRVAVDIVIESDAEPSRKKCLAAAREDIASGYENGEVCRPERLDRVAGLPRGWANAYPLGGEGPRTCREILTAEAKE